MPLSIQRFPRGLNDVLSIFGGQTPAALADEVRGTIDLLQFYANSQITRATTINAAAAEAVPVTITVPGNQWWILLRAHTRVVKTATMTALTANVFIGTVIVASSQLGPFGATETGSVFVPFIPPYPTILRPGDVIQGNASIIGTDATADIAIVAEFGVLG